MKFVMIYGPSGIGKESIAFDVACAVIGFGNDGFERYQRKICLEAFKRLFEKGVDGVIFTFCYVYPASNYFMEGLTSLLDEYEIGADFIRVSCDLDEHVSRVTSAGRKNTNKIQTKEYLEDYLMRFNFGVDVPGVNTFHLDSTQLSPAEASSEIAKQIRR